MVYKIEPTPNILFKMFQLGILSKYSSENKKDDSNIFVNKKGIGPRSNSTFINGLASLFIAK